jgi:hypothetical protein
MLTPAAAPDSVPKDANDSKDRQGARRGSWWLHTGRARPDSKAERASILKISLAARHPNSGRAKKFSPRRTKGLIKKKISLSFILGMVVGASR